MKLILVIAWAPCCICMIWNVIHFVIFFLLDSCVIVQVDCVEIRLCFQTAKWVNVLANNDGKKHQDWSYSKSEIYSPWPLGRMASWFLVCDCHGDQCDVRKDAEIETVDMAPTFCSRCGDAVDEGCDPRDELAELDALAERLRLKRYDLKRKINRHHSPIIRHLPPDVMSTIFEFCLTDFTDRQLFLYRKEDFLIPLSLGAICSYWRDIAWSTPSLWSSMVVGIANQRDLHISTCIAQEWLARSGQLPLSIRISSRSYNHNAISHIISALANVINQYSNRWSELDLYIPGFYYQCFHATHNHAPILKSIRFQCPFNSNTVNSNFQLTCPRLERASLCLFPMDGTNIQWDNLTHLNLQSMSVTNSFLILRKTPRLVFCKVLGCCPPYMEQSTGVLVLTSLRSLQVITRYAIGFLNNLTAPPLEEFSLPRFFTSSMEVTTSFLRRSACSLRSFTMIVSSPYFNDFMSLLQSMPSLNSLSIMAPENITNKDYDPRNILQLVAKVLSSQNTSLQQGFLPNLRILEYTGKLYLPSRDYDDLYFLPPVDNAVHGPLHLLKLELHPVTRIPKIMISYLSSLVERGVTVEVSSDWEDILQPSIDYYRCRKDSLCRDWTDNFDSNLFSWLFCGVVLSQIEKKSNGEYIYIRANLCKSLILFYQQ